MQLDVVELYKSFHQIPELSLHEEKTAALIAKKLREIGYTEVIEHFGDTQAVVAYKRTGKPGPTVMVRADMDALPFKDPDGTIQAVHACGHDGHVSMLLAAAAKLLDTVQKGTLKLLFQPAEETNAGALAMIKANILDDVDIAFGMHIRPQQDMPAGNLSPKVSYNACAFLVVDIDGVSCHAARPHLGVNCAEAAALVTSAVCMMKLDPALPWSCKVTKIETSSPARNIVPDHAQLWIDARCGTNALMEVLLEKVTKAINGAVAALDAKVTITHGFRLLPATVYDDALVAEAREEIIRIFGQEHLTEDSNGGGEDFSYYAVAKPSLRCAYFGIGVGAAPGLHNRTMCFEPKYLSNGVELMTAMVLRQLG